MLRNDIEKRTGLTRKAIEYYEYKGFIKPNKLENGYRDYSDNDLDCLNKIVLYKKLGLSLDQIKDIILNGKKLLPSVLRKKEYQLEIENERKDILKMLIDGKDEDMINSKLRSIDIKESIYSRLESAFPGYFGQVMFSSYKPFLDDALEDKNKEYFDNYIEYLDNLPKLELTNEEKEYIESTSSSIDMNLIDNINSNKLEAIDNFETWFYENKEIIKEYDSFKNSCEYQKSPMKNIQDKIKSFMLENKYYETAIPLIRRFSPKYNNYYNKLIIANEKFINLKDNMK